MVLSNRDKGLLCRITRYGIHGLKYEFKINQYGEIHFGMPGTTSGGWFREARYERLEDVKTYLAELIKFVVLRLLRKDALTSPSPLHRWVAVAPEMYKKRPGDKIFAVAGPGQLEIWEVLEETGWTLELLKTEVFNEPRRRR